MGFALAYAVRIRPACCPQTRNAFSDTGRTGCSPYFAINHNVGFAIPMFIGTVVGSISVVFALLLSPETKGKILVSDLVVA